MTSSHIRFAALLALSLVLCLGLTGCGSKVNEANAEKIKNDMTEAQVKDILGAPTETENNGNTLVWKNGNDSIKVAFVNGKVAMKISSYDAKKMLGGK